MNVVPRVLCCLAGNAEQAILSKPPFKPDIGLSGGAESDISADKNHLGLDRSTHLESKRLTGVLSLGPWLAVVGHRNQ